MSAPAIFMPDHLGVGIGHSHHRVGSVVDGQLPSFGVGLCRMRTGQNVGSLQAEEVDALVSTMTVAWGV